MGGKSIELRTMVKSEENFAAFVDVDAVSGPALGRTGTSSADDAVGPMTCDPHADPCEAVAREFSRRSRPLS